MPPAAPADPPPEVGPAPEGDPISHALCERVRGLRKKRGWTLEQLSVACGVSRSMLSQIERGQANPTLGVAYRIAQAFGLPLGEMVEAPSAASKIETIRAGDRNPHLNYRFQQDVQRSHSGALTDHEFNMWQTEMLMTRKIADYYHFDGQFVAIQAYEWTGSSPACAHDGGPFGHLNALYLEPEGQLAFYNPSDANDPGATPARLFERYRDQRVMTPPHHVADNLHVYHWGHFDPDEPALSTVEIFQDLRGSGERPDAPGVTNFLHNPEAGWIVDKLREGLRFGFIGGGDHTGVARAGVCVDELTRQGLYDALRRRRCFATTGVAASVRFTCNDARMGEPAPAGHADFRLRVRCAAPLRTLWVVVNGEDRPAVTLDGARCEHDWTLTTRPGDFVYARLMTAEGELIWTSPIFFA